MKILIIGASGLVGGNLFKYLSENTEFEITGTYNNYRLEPFINFDASEKSSWSKSIVKTKWDIIVHTGALTHVDRCEQEPELSYYLTVKSVHNVCLFASEIGAKLIYISTDYVFDGNSGPYTELDSPNPINVYGKHKLEAENFVKSCLIEYLILRITNVYGDEVRSKNMLSRTISQITTKSNLSITAPFDQYATPVNAHDIAKAILVLINNKKTGIYHIASTDFLNRVQFIQKVNSYFNNVLNINAVTTEQLNQIAPRPLLGGLIAQKFLNEFPEFCFSNLDSYLNANKKVLGKSNTATSGDK